MVLGVAVAVAASVLRLRGAPARVLVLVVTAVVAGAFVALCTWGGSVTGLL